MVHEMSSTVFFLLFSIALTRVDNQQIQQSYVNAATCLLAVRSGLSPGRKSDRLNHCIYIAIWRSPCLVCVRHQPDGSLTAGPAMTTNEDRGLFDPIFETVPRCIGRGSSYDRAIVDYCHLVEVGHKFDSCTMSRSTNDLDVNFIRDADGLLLLLKSSKWRLERGKAYPVTLIAGSRSIEVKAAAEPKGVSVPLTDRPLNERMRTANILEVVGEGATLRVPLDGSTAALARLEACFEKNSRQNSDTNPFVAPNRKP